MNTNQHEFLVIHLFPLPPFVNIRVHSCSFVAEILLLECYGDGEL
jgi:hypothetical protein